MRLNPPLMDYLAVLALPLDRHGLANATRMLMTEATIYSQKARTLLSWVMAAVGLGTAPQNGTLFSNVFGGRQRTLQFARSIVPEAGRCSTDGNLVGHRLRVLQVDSGVCPGS